jgi:hypothetical protein
LVEIGDSISVCITGIIDVIYFIGKIIDIGSGRAEHFPAGKEFAVAQIDRFRCGSLRSFRKQHIKSIFERII